MKEMAMSGGKAMPAFSAAAFNDLATGGGGHSGSKTVSFLVFSFVGLIGASHVGLKKYL